MDERQRNTATETKPKDKKKEKKKKKEGAAHGVLVKEVKDHAGQSVVAPVAVDEQQPAEEAEARHGKVRRHHGLHALGARDADADVGRLDHRHVVGAVPCEHRSSPHPPSHHSLFFSSFPFPTNRFGNQSTLTGSFFFQ